MVLPLAAAWIALVAFHFPYHTDSEPSASDVAKEKVYYDRAFAVAAGTAPGRGDSDYVTALAKEAATSGVRGAVERFVADHNLKGARVLDVGAGTGYLQDLVDDYTGIDIAPTAARFFTKRFVVGSATALPFRDNEFDAAWSVWVLEHVPNPEQALREMRRVVRDNGLLYLRPAWNCSPWAAEGYEVRPYSDFDLAGKLTKAAIPIRASRILRPLHTRPVRMLRLLSVWAAGSPSRLHYEPLRPNYTRLWAVDGDAVNSIDRAEAVLWFTSRGDECLNCSGLVAPILLPGRPPDEALIIRLRKHRS